MIDLHRPDVVFLDIRMPGLNGLQVLERVTHAPRVVFTTAYEEFAVAAFEIRAIDYLLKPFSAHRLRVALDRFREAAIAPTALLDRVGAALRREVPRQVFVRTNGALLAIATDRIDRIEGSDDYCSVWTNGRSYLLYRRLAEFADVLEPAGFLRVHRSHIVNLARVAAVRTIDGGRLELTMKGGAIVPVSRSYVSALRAALTSHRT